MGEKTYIDEIAIAKLVKKIEKKVSPNALVTVIIRNPNNIFAESVYSPEKSLRDLLPVIERLAIKDAWGKGHKPGESNAKT